MSSEASTLVEIVQHRAKTTGDKVAYTFVGGSLEVEAQMTFAELDRSARAIAKALREEIPGSAPERALLVFAPGLDYVRAFFGCLYAGIIAVPTYPPTGRNADTVRKIVADCDARVMLTTANLSPDLGIPSIAVDTLPATGEFTPNVRADGIAFLQYTSGSTGVPKGVMVTHENLIDNAKLIQRAFAATAEDVGFTWLPMYHDMGLIGTILQPAYVGCSVVVSSPIRFIQNPLRWLEAIGKFKVTVTGGPNFAYRLCTERASEADLAKLDLSTWRLAFNGAEPVRSETLRAFTRKFAPAGFDARAMCPAYGLAESTLLVACSERGTEPKIAPFEKTELAGYRLGDVSARVRIVDPETRSALPDGSVGEIWTSSASVARGYWNREELSDATFRATIAGEDRTPYLRTGDLGFVRDGHLYVTGRAKDLIIVRGRNYYPQDIEATAVASDTALAPDGAVAFAHDESIVVVAEVERDRLNSIDVDDICRGIRRTLAQNSGLVLSDVVLVRPGKVARTSSGKVRRNECKQLWLEGKLERINPHRERAVVALTADEKKIADVCLAVLGVAPESSDTTIFDLGADSIKIVELTAALEKVAGRKIPVAALYEASSLGALAELVATGTIQQTELDLYREAVLPDDIVAHDVHETSRHALVTGATGFLGAYLVAELLSVEGMEVSCLVRARTDVEARERVLENLRRYELEVDTKRLHAVAGDLGATRFGWNERRFKAFADKIECVYHSAAAVDWALPYHWLKRANVDATIEVLRFACTGRGKPVHHVSTMWVFPLGKGGDPEFPIDLESRLPRAEGLRTGYNKSKWVAERLVAAARERGLPVTIHRMDFITAANGKTGGFKMTDLVPRLVRDAVNLGALPSDDIRLDLVAVDTLAKMIVSLSRSDKAQNKNFHLLNHERLSLTSLIKLLGDAGYKVGRLPFTDWRSQVASNQKSALFPLVPMLDSYDTEDLEMSIKQGADNSQAIRHLEELEPGLSKANPSMESVIHRLVGELRREKLIPTPKALQ